LTEAKIVVAVWREGSLTAAAERLNISLATVSRRLSDLEQSLGVVLFERTTRALRATTAGHQLARRLELGLAEIDAALRSVHEEAGQAVGIVRMSVPPSLSEILTPILHDLRTNHPGIRLHVYVTEKRLHFADEDIDVLLRVGRLEEENLVAAPLTRYRHQLVAHPDRVAAIRTPNDLQEHPALVWGSEHNAARWTLQKGKKIHAITPTPSILSNDYELLAQLAASGTGVAEIPAIVAVDSRNQERILRVLPEWELPEVTLSILYSPHLLPTSVRIVVDHFKQAFAKQDPTCKPNQG
jgi:DNA-binding transcriptional LysR family regulator